MSISKAYKSHISTRYFNVKDTNKSLPVLYTNRESCCGCTACYSVCPVSAIKMIEDEEGFLYPSVDASKCVGCKRCIQICTFKTNQLFKGQNMNVNTTHKGLMIPKNYKDGQFDTPITFAVKHRHFETRMASRSGGIFTALSDYVLDKEGIVYGCILTENNIVAAHLRAESKNERDRMRGSKYIQSELRDTFLCVKKDLENSRIVLFSGTSCQIAGLKGYLGKEYENLFLVDIVCHGVPSPLVWSAYVKWQEEKNGESVRTVDFRNKKDFGWKAHIESLTFKSGKKVDSSIFKILFYKHAILRPCCYECPYKDIIHPGDITIADYWGIDTAAPGFNDNKGVSLVLINNQKGLEFFSYVNNEIDFVKTKIEDSIQPPLKAPFSRPKNREEVWVDFYKMPFSKFVKKHVEDSLVIKIKKFVWRLIHS